MHPSRSTSHPASEAGYILTLCMIFVILISLSLISLLQTLAQDQRLHTEFQMNAQIQALEPGLMLKARQEAGQENLKLTQPNPRPSAPPTKNNPQNELHLRAVVIENGQSINIWQGWFFAQDPQLPMNALFEAMLRCPANNNHCEISHWQRIIR